MPLDLAPRLSDPDALFAALVAAHERLLPGASRRLDAKLVLLLANHIGDTGVVLDALRVAQETGEPADEPADEPTDEPAEEPA